MFTNIKFCKWVSMIQSVILCSELNNLNKRLLTVMGCKQKSHLLRWLPSHFGFASSSSSFYYCYYYYYLGEWVVDIGYTLSLIGGVLDGDCAVNGEFQFEGTYEIG